jgi:hypothetical protein
VIGLLWFISVFITHNYVLNISFFVAVLIFVGRHSNYEKCINSWETRRLKANFCTVLLERRNIQYSLESEIKWVNVNEASKNKVKCSQPKCWQKCLLLLLFNRLVETGKEVEI